jgi:hypothetical protein
MVWATRKNAKKRGTAHMIFLTFLLAETLWIRFQNYVKWVPCHHRLAGKYSLQKWRVCEYIK